MTTARFNKDLLRQKCQNSEKTSKSCLGTTDGAESLKTRIDAIGHYTEQFQKCQVSFSDFSTYVVFAVLIFFL